MRTTAAPPGRRPSCCLGGHLFLAAAASAEAPPPARPGSAGRSTCRRRRRRRRSPLETAPPLPTPIAHPGDASSTGCVDCHAQVDKKQEAIAEDWKASIHAKEGVGCADCHGGDPRSDEITVGMAEENGFLGVPGRDQTVGLCGGCHANAERMRPYQVATDQYSKYFSSVHGQRLLVGEGHPGRHLRRLPRLARRSSRRPIRRRRSTRSTSRDLCASCHADADQDAAVRHPDRPVRDLQAERPRHAAARGAGPPGAHLRLLPRLPRRQAAALRRGRRRLREVPHGDPGAVRGERPLAGPGGRAQVLDVPRHPRRQPAGRAPLPARGRRPRLPLRDLPQPGGPEPPARDRPFRGPGGPALRHLPSRAVADLLPRSRRSPAPSAGRGTATRRPSRGSRRRRPSA